MDRLPTFTIGTPTYNRASLLKRLYKSICAQTFKDFVWLIVDDGSSDDTRNVVEQFISENKVRIIYHYQENRGLYYADKYLNTHFQSRYYLRIDDDDTLTPDCLQVFKNEWDEIEKERKSKIGCIRALSVDENGLISGNSNIFKQSDKIDTTYIEVEWVKAMHMENITCLKSEVFQQVDLYKDEKKWLFDKISMEYESVFWNRIAFLYETRYINKKLRVYYHDAESSLTRDSFSKTKCYNYVFTIYNMLNDLGSTKSKNMRMFLRELGKYWTCAIAIKLPFVKAIVALNGCSSKVYSLLVYPFAYLVSRRIVK